MRLKQTGIPFASMCKGPNPEQVRKHKECAEYHEMMVKFYGLMEGQQKTFMVYFQSLSDEQVEARKKEGDQP